jgi:endonuclease III
MTRLETLLSRLQRFYGLLPAPPRDPFAIFLWETLSMHTTPARRDAALGALKRIRVLTPDAMWRAPQKKLADAVALAGPYQEERLRALRTGVDLFRRSPKLPAVIRGPLGAARRALKPFPQLGDAYARRMLLFAADRCVLGVDMHISRVGRRLGYGKTSDSARKSTRSVQRALSRELARDADRFRRASLYLSHHALATCTEGDPHCHVCPLLQDCPEGKTRAVAADKLKSEV